MELLERERQLATLADHAATAFGGSGALVLVCGEPGAGKTSFIDAFLADLEGRRGGTLRVLSAVCDPLSTPRPLGPVLDLAGQLGAAARTAIEESDHAHAIFTAVFDDLAAEPTVLVVDDLHWADQGTVDLLRFVLRRIGTTRSLVIGAVRDEELGLSHPMRGLLGDVARSADAESLRLPPLSLAAIETLTAGSDLDADRLLHLTGGNAFFVAEMLDHRGDDLPTTVRDAVLSRTAGLGVGAWDLLNLLTSAPEAIPDRLLPRLGATLPALRELDAAGLIRRGPRGVTFRHDLCRLAVSSVIPPGAGAALHVRMIGALEAVPGADPAVLVHHALGAGDGERILRYADLAGRAAARSGAHAGRRVLPAGAGAGSPDGGRRPGSSPRAAGRRALPHRSTRGGDRPRALRCSCGRTSATWSARASCTTPSPSTSGTTPTVPPPNATWRHRSPHSAAILRSPAQRP